MFAPPPSHPASYGTQHVRTPPPPRRAFKCALILPAPHPPSPTPQGLHVRVWRGYEDFLDEMAERFPDEKDNVAKFYGECWKVCGCRLGGGGGRPGGMLWACGQW